jgi:hypothetical protein
MTKKKKLSRLMNCKMLYRIALKTTLLQFLTMVILIFTYLYRGGKGGGLPARYRLWSRCKLKLKGTAFNERVK